MQRTQKLLARTPGQESPSTNKEVKPKKKYGKSLWVKAFPAQAKALHPAKTAAGGVKARSTPEEIRMAVYRAIRLLYLSRHEWCECCVWIRETNHPSKATTIHHLAGRVGWMLVDVRRWKSACLACHTWIGNNPEKARELGLICDKGNWNKIT